MRLPWAALVVATACGPSGSSSSTAATDDAATAGTTGVVPPTVGAQAENSDAQDDVIVDAPSRPVTPPLDPASCGGTVVPTHVNDVVLAFVFDVSASMGADGDTRVGYSRTLKWDPVVEATKNFFEDPASAGLSATLSFFPNEYAPFYDPRESLGPLPAAACDPAEYAEPDVPLTPLPSDVFSTGIDAITPDPDNRNWRSYTPTLPALQGTFDALLAMKSEHPDTTYAVVLVTDGEPFGCADASIEAAAAAIREVSASVPTYVIGVKTPIVDEQFVFPTDPNFTPPFTDDFNEGLQNLGKLAEAGGTGHDVFLIDTQDPDQTTSSFSEVINQIRDESFSCELPINSDNEFDPRAVNVAFEDASGKTAYYLDQECESDFGWRYDNPDNPTAIELCPGPCDRIRQAARDGELSVELGCPAVVYMPPQ